MPKKLSLAQADQLRHNNTETSPSLDVAPSDPQPRSVAPKPRTQRRTPAPVTKTPPAAPPSRRGKSGVTTYVDPDFLKRLKRCALEHEQSQDSLIHEALERLLTERGF